MTDQPMTHDFESLNPPVRVIYIGRVQGVGFRWTCRSIAKNHAVTGTVQNLPDGSVELVVSGDPQPVADFLKAIGSKMSQNIEATTITPLPENGEFEGFCIL